MSSSLWSADRRAHIKIIAVSLVMTAVIVVVGSSARNFSSDSARNYVDPRPVVAGQPVNLSAASSSTIR
jgi:hypothetical protein